MRARVPSVPEFIESCNELIKRYDEGVGEGIDYEDQAGYADQFRDELVEAVGLLSESHKKAQLLQAECNIIKDARTRHEEAIRRRP